MGHVITWDQLKSLGEGQSNSVLDQREMRQEVNKACMVIFTSGTTGLPKGRVFFQTLNSHAGKMLVLLYRCFDKP